MREETKIPARLWAVIGENGGIWGTFDTKEKADGYPGPRMLECAPRYVIEYTRPDPLTELERKVVEAAIAERNSGFKFEEVRAFFEATNALIEARKDKQHG